MSHCLALRGGGGEGGQHQTGWRVLHLERLCACLYQHCLAIPRWSKEEDALGGGAETSKQLEEGRGGEGRRGEGRGGRGGKGRGGEMEREGRGGEGRGGRWRGRGGEGRGGR